MYDVKAVQDKGAYEVIEYTEMLLTMHEWLSVVRLGLGITRTDGLQSNLSQSQEQVIVIVIKNYQVRIRFLQMLGEWQRLAGAFACPFTLTRPLHPSPCFINHICTSLPCDVLPNPLSGYICVTTSDLHSHQQTSAYPSPTTINVSCSLFDDDHRPLSIVA
jgi:hypothetical protein